MLAEQGVDFARLARLAHLLRVTGEQVRTAVAADPRLGICAEPEPVVYCLPAGPVAAGFEVRRRAGRLLLRLPGRGLRPALLLSGCYLDPGMPYERIGTVGAGALAYTVARLTSLARHWLPPVPDPTRHLFELTAETWRHGARQRQAGPLAVYRADFTELIATGPGLPDGGTNRLELVTNRCWGGYRLVHVYPVPGRGCA
ncbi:hypothetical protein GCM10023321_80680 [Pseudonocardia eucalypti]|uniref:Uncharacterized protein n=2 Tax=Pseudonocardia eucalypti TaxID=648755 RepID=A0ABP9RCK5_9PSEU